MEAGQRFVVRDGDGNIWYRDRGVLKTTFQVDTMGDTDLDNDVFIEDSFEVLADNGRHPASTSTAAGALRTTSSDSHRADSSVAEP